MRNPSDPRDSVARWLAAEREARDADAEAALATLFRLLPEPRLAAGFAQRVLAEALPLQRRAPWWRRLEVQAAALLLACAAGLALLPLWLTPAWRLLAPTRWLAAGTWLATSGARAFATGAEVWSGLAAIGRIAFVVASDPRGLVLILTCAAIAAGAARFLSDALSDRSFRYVER